MVLKICLILFFVGLPFFASGQNKLDIQRSRERIDYFRSRLTTCREDTNKVNLLDSISSNYIRISPDSGIVYAQRALALSTDLNWKPGKARAFQNFGILFYYKGEYNTALTNSENALHLYKELGFKTGTIKVLTNIADIHSRQGDYPLALEYNFKALSIAEQEKSTTLVASCYNNIAYIYNSESDYIQSLAFYRKALQLFNAKKDSSKIAFTLKSIGNVFYVQSKNDSARAYYDSSLKISTMSHDDRNTAESLMGIGNLFSDKGVNDTALDYQFRALEIYKEQNDKSWMGNSLANIGITYLAIAGDTIVPKAKGRIPAGSAANLKLATEYLENAVAIEKETGELNTLELCYNYLSQANELAGNYKDALTNHKLYVSVRDSIFSVQNTMKYASIQAQHEKENQKKIDDIKKIYYSLGVGLLLVIVVLIGMGYRTQRKLNKTITKLVNEQELTIKARTNELAVSNEQLALNNKNLIALVQFNAHNVREPVTRIKGAMIIQEYMTNEEFYEEIWPQMQKAINDLDNIILEVIRKADDAIEMQG